MIRDYSKYEMSEKEKFMFLIFGFLIISGLVFLFYHNVIISLVSGIFIKKLTGLYENYKACLRIQKLNKQFKDMLYSVSASIASGRQMAEALVEAYYNLSVIYSDDEPIMLELAHMKRSILENNESDRILLSDFAQRSHSEDICNFVQVYITCRNMGGNLEKIISRTTDILTDKMNIEREIKALTAQKKLEGRLIAAMPPAMLLILNILSPSYIAPLYTCFLGRLIMTGCLGGICWGVWMMEKISTVDV